jgi:hypothetical protein
LRSKEVDMSDFIKPNSTQTNADDFLAGPKTVRITKVSGTGNSDQPVAIFFEGDDGKPYLPCRSMRRVLVAAWGIDASSYVGRSMTLFRDPQVIYGGLAVGGIRISAMSHIASPLNLALSVTKAKRAQYRVSPLTVAAAGEGAPTAKDQPPAATRTAHGQPTDSPRTAGHVGDDFGLPPLTEDGVPLDLAAIKATYEGYKTAKNQSGCRDWIGALVPAAQAFVRKLIDADKQAAAS